MSDAARAFARVFRHIDFVPSDFATSLVLVGISHSEARPFPPPRSTPPAIFAHVHTSPNSTALPPSQEQRKKEEDEWSEHLARTGGFSGAAQGLEQSPLLRPPQRHLYPIATDPHLSDGEDVRSRKWETRKEGNPQRPSLAPPACLPACLLSAGAGAVRPL